MELYCDLDGVLVNFIKGNTEEIEKAINTPEEEIRSEKFLNRIRKVKKELNGRTTIIPGEQSTKGTELRRLSFNVITGRPDFWENLEWHPGGKELWDGIKRYSPTILTAPINTDLENCKKGKLAWCENHLNYPESKVIIEGDKHLYAKDKVTGIPNILIDDTPKKINAWVEHGGIGVLYNGNYNETIKIVQGYFEENRMKELSGL